MHAETGNLQILFILSVGFTFASILGYLSNRLNLSPFLGYLLAGYLIGPYSPGYVADLHLSEQLAEIGVVLMMFGVGLHFKWQDLVNVKYIAITGAVGQTFVAATLGAWLIYSLGWSIEAGVVFGLGIGVASTVVLVSMLSENKLLNSPQGHVAIGWLLVEDIITIFVLLFIPTLAAFAKGNGPGMQQIGIDIAAVLLKFGLLIALVFTIGRKVVAYVLAKVALTKSHELFTLTILALTFAIASGASVAFGTSIALGAFIAGMVIGQTDLRQQVSKSTEPLKDTFLVIFFLSIGMLFNPSVIGEHLLLVLGVLLIIIVAKPLTAFLIVVIMRHPLKTALTVSVALAQIGEFSFILAEEAMRNDILPDVGYDVIIACAIVSIAVNPILFKVVKPFIISKKEGAESEL